MMWSSLLALVGVSVVSAQDYQLIWSDEFDGGEIDFSKWSHEVTAGGGGNAEFQVYLPDPVNSYVQDGKLNIKPTPLSDNINPLTGQPFGEDFLRNGFLDLEAMYGVCTEQNPDWFGCQRGGGTIPPVASARLRTADKFSFRYGRVLISAKMPVGDWLWPAMWLLPEKWLYGGWPMSGEIDITEAIGNRNLVCDGTFMGIQHMGATLHWGVNWDENKWWLTHGTKNNDANNYGDSFHDYQLDWSPQGLEFFIDGDKVVSIPDPLIHERNPGSCWTGFYDFGSPWNRQTPWNPEQTCDHFMAPFDQEFHFILNVAVGGRWFIPDGCVNRNGEAGHQKPWVNGGGQIDLMWSFYEAREFWEQSWMEEGDNMPMQVDYVRVYQPSEGYPRTQVPAGCPEQPFPDNCPMA